jgi:hypothetical protein
MKEPIRKVFFRRIEGFAQGFLGLFLNIRGKPETPIPDETTIILVPEGGCATDWEELVK